MEGFNRYFLHFKRGSEVFLEIVQYKD